MYGQPRTGQPCSGHWAGRSSCSPEPSLGPARDCDPDWPYGDSGGCPFLSFPTCSRPHPGFVFWISPRLAQRLRGSHGAQWLCGIQETAADAPPESMWKVKLPAPLSSVGLSVLTTWRHGFITLYLRPSDLYPYVMTTGLDGSHCNC